MSRVLAAGLRRRRRSHREVSSKARATLSRTPKTAFKGEEDFSHLAAFQDTRIHDQSSRGGAPLNTLIPRFHALT